MNRWVVPIMFLFVILVSAAFVSGGILSGVSLPGGFEARWSAGTSPSVTNPDGPHQCLVPRAQNDASYSQINSDGSFSWVQDCDECFCNTVGENDFDCSSFDECIACPSACNTQDSAVCAPQDLECEFTNGLCDNTYRCYCDALGRCSGTECSGDKRYDKYCSTTTTCSLRNGVCDSTCGAACEVGDTRACSDICVGRTVQERDQACSSSTCNYGSCYDAGTPSCISGRCGALCSDGYDESSIDCFTSGGRLYQQGYRTWCTGTCVFDSTYPSSSECTCADPYDTPTCTEGSWETGTSRPSGLGCGC